jgi:hypothetical protein
LGFGHGFRREELATLGFCLRHEGVDGVIERIALRLGEKLPHFDMDSGRAWRTFVDAAGFLESGLFDRFIAQGLIGRVLFADDGLAKIIDRLADGGFGGREVAADIENLTNIAEVVEILFKVGPLGEAKIAKEDEDLRVLIGGDAERGIRGRAEILQGLEEGAVVNDAFTFTPAIAGKGSAVARNAGLSDRGATERGIRGEILGARFLSARARGGKGRTQQSKRECEPGNLHGAPEREWARHRNPKMRTESDDH